MNQGRAVVMALVHAAEEGGYWAEVPELPGCFTQGETLHEVRENLTEAIQLWLEASGADGGQAEIGDRIVAVMPIPLPAA